MSCWVFDRKWSKTYFWMANCGVQVDFLRTVPSKVLRFAGFSAALRFKKALQKARATRWLGRTKRLFLPALGVAACYVGGFYVSVDIG